MIRVYGHPMSDNSRKVHWALEELGIPYEMLTVDLFKGEHHQPAFLAKNPIGRIPILEDGDVRLVESIAILWYLGERYGAGKLLPEGLTARAEVLQWLSYQACHYGPALERPWTMKIVAPMMGQPCDDGARQRLCDEARPWLSRLDEHLSPREFVVGKAFTIADVALAEPTTLAAQAGIELTPWPNLRAWFERMQRRSAFTKTRPQM
jgi:glutathione S-transferase